MSKFFKPGKTELQRQFDIRIKKQERERQAKESEHPEECAEVIRRLEASDSEETVNSCLGYLVSGGFTEAHAATFIEYNLTAIMKRRREEGEKIERDVTEANPQ